MPQVSRHFKRREFACACGCGFDTIDSETLRILEAVRQHFGAPVVVTSAARCRQHNADVGGASRSQHIYGRAADIKVTGHPAAIVADFIEEQFPWASVGRYLTFTHVDTRTHGPARWGRNA
ncbi:Peptidase M15 [Halomonas shengliensis]|uniref:Peptidase M15 n=1 Tax=Halomonas shengliensis TaxID=419597 RepID=A0A1H0LW60_9GAMM|nr:D-Ala-D-Ala carboxypeptidase family metallohydrolase [Halomonas shengliensis]SDO72160.1 Peptidase M15 [Halomonas shengliensis]